MAALLDRLRTGTDVRREALRKQQGRSHGSEAGFIDRAEGGASDKAPSLMRPYPPRSPRSVEQVCSSFLPEDLPTSRRTDRRRGDVGSLYGNGQTERILPVLFRVFY